MKRLLQILPVFLLLNWISWSLPAQKPINRLTHEMSPEEAARKHEIGRDFKGTNPPPGDIRNIAEYDPMQGVLVRYPFGIPYTLIAAMSQETNVTTIVASQNEKNYVINQYTNNGVNLDHCDFLIAASDSYWTRDFGPWFITYGTDQIGIVDFVYNRPRPMDDLIPQHMADFLGIDWFGMEIIHTGGNYMTDAYNISSSTDLVWNENPSITHAQLNDSMHIFLGINQYHVVEDPNNTYIDHIDCWGKFLGPSKILIRSVPETHPQYDEIEATAAYYASQTSSYGIPYQVHRVYTPNNQPYTNSLICNNRVFVPITGSQWDDEATASYQEAMPGFTIQGFTGSWESTDALHCRVIGIADLNTLYINHLPLLGEQPVNPSGYDLDVAITAYSLETVVNSSVKVHYSVNGGTFSEIVMTHLGGKNYTATIPQPAPGSTVSYYISAEDAAGNNGNHPFIGEADPHVFTIGTQLLPNIVLDVTAINSGCHAGNLITDEFTISNSGLVPLDFSLEVSISSEKSNVFVIPECQQYNAADAATIEVPETGIIQGLSLEYDWKSDEWPEESSFYIESPSGNRALIASGTLPGHFYFEPDGFKGESTAGTWKLWIADAAGDGGHEASNMALTLNTKSSKTDWLSVDPQSGTLNAGGEQIITVTSDATELGEGVYTGNIQVNSNDPDQPQIDIPVTFTVVINTGISQETDPEHFGISPNPVNQSAVFSCTMKESGAASLSVVDSRGVTVAKIFEGTLPQGTHSLNWNIGNAGQDAIRKGVYFARFVTHEQTRVVKVIVK